MPTSLTSFRVVGLHGRKTVDVYPKENRLVLIGENGTGKSTLANFIYYFLTKQWERIHEHKFKVIEATLNGRQLSITPEQLEQHLHRASIRRSLHLPKSALLRWNAFSSRLSSAQIIHMRRDTETLRLYAREAGLPVSFVSEMLDATVHDQAEPTEIQRITDEISSVVTEQFLYLPTYRRIEHDLQWIFRGGEIDMDELRKSLVGGGSEAYVELVHFGMEDVEQKIQARMAHLKDNFRAGLNNLTGSYLHEVIQGAYQRASFEDLRQIDLRVLDSILSRIPDETLPPTDKVYLKEKVSHFAVAYEQSDNIVAHFLLKLLTLHRQQEEKESDVRTFIDVCNVYLTGKKLVYDNAKYEIAIEITDDAAASNENHETLRLRMLSSGEKQIISLFSHIYLSTERRFFVIIDEPELSLSVAWQRRFLPDILKTGKCEGLVAVTHSPFIWQNEMEEFVHTLHELTASAHGLR